MTHDHEHFSLGVSPVRLALQRGENFIYRKLSSTTDLLNPDKKVVAGLQFPISEEIYQKIESERTRLTELFKSPDAHGDLRLLLECIRAEYPSIMSCIPKDELSEVSNATKSLFDAIGRQFVRLDDGDYMTDVLMQLDTLFKDNINPERLSRIGNPTSQKSLECLAELWQENRSNNPHRNLYQRSNDVSTIEILKEQGRELIRTRPDHFSIGSIDLREETGGSSWIEQPT